jgi:hypothetical protein
MHFERHFWNRRRRAGGGLVSALAGVAAGAGLMYFLEPGRGTRRRTRVAQRATRALHDVETTVESGARDLRHRAAGLAHEARARVAHEEVSDDVLVERVRAKLGRLTAHARAIEVAVSSGAITLGGDVLRAEHGRVVRGVRRVRGVSAVTDRLVSHETREGTPALQGGAPTVATPSWTGSPALKLLAGAAGAALAGRALLGGGLGRIPLALAGATLVRNLASPSHGRRERRAARRAGAEATHREQERGERASHRGAWHPEPEVQEVKSPAELRPGVASGSPEPTFSNRVDRPGKAPPRARGGGWQASAVEDEPGEGAGDLSRRPEYLAPPEGAGVREGDLGSVASPDAGEEEPEGGSGRGSGSAGGAPRRDPGVDDG